MPACTTTYYSSSLIACLNQFWFKFEVKGTEAQSKSETASNNKARGRMGEPSDGRECKIGFKALETARTARTQVSSHETLSAPLPYPYTATTAATPAQFHQIL